MVPAICMFYMFLHVHFSASFHSRNVHNMQAGLNCTKHIFVCSDRGRGAIKKILTSRARADSAEVGTAGIMTGSVSEGEDNPGVNDEEV